MWYYHIHANLSKKWQLRTPDRPQDIVVWWGSDCYCLENCLMFKFVFVSVRFESPTKLTSVLIQRCQLMLKWPGIRKKLSKRKAMFSLHHLLQFLPVFKKAVEIEKCRHRENCQRTQRGWKTHRVRPAIEKSKQLLLYKEI